MRAKVILCILLTFWLSVLVRWVVERVRGRFRGRKPL